MDLYIGCSLPHLWYWCRSPTPNSSNIRLVPPTSFPYTLLNTPNSRSLELHTISFPRTMPYCSPTTSLFIPGPTSTDCGIKFSPRSSNHPFYSGAFIFTSYLILIDKITWLAHGSKVVLPFLPQIYLLKTSWDVCCSQTVPNLLYLDHLTSVIFPIIFFSNQKYWCLNLS